MKKFYFHWEGKTLLTPAQQEEIKTKTKRRARRHFRGQVVRHRVVEKTPLTITFKFKRCTGSPVTIRWRTV